MSEQAPSLDFSLVLANTVHDMKNSLSMVVGALDQITEQCGNAGCASQQMFSQLRYEGKRLNSNLIQILTLYRIESDHYSLNISEQDVSELLEECYLENEGLLALKGIELEMDCEEDLLCFLDRELISSILNSVVNNAFKYTRDRIRIGARREDGYTAIFIEENGGGYPATMLHGAGQAPADIDIRNGSTGLGLYFTATIARMHHHKDRCGYITTTNDGIDGGGRFTLYLP
ncbi:MAG TPA: HAMP domain-containing sensor histidine kinase [Gammaproteobacteria bacterium]|nr:HAMP domain-containing sensor histidine kinase [Gammaproteobacteria bacterium]